MSRISTSNGRAFEVEIAARLEAEGITYIEQPTDFPKRVSITITPDFQIGDLYVFAQQDFFNGGQQSDRFGHVVQMDEFVWEKGSVFYVLKHPYLKQPKRKPTDKQLLKQSRFDDLVERQVIGSLDQLMERINGTMPKD